MSRDRRVEKFKATKTEVAAKATCTTARVQLSALGIAELQSQARVSCMRRAGPPARIASPNCNLPLRFAIALLQIGAILASASTGAQRSRWLAPGRSFKVRSVLQ
jgi:hypothetical protein